DFEPEIIRADPRGSQTANLDIQTLVEHPLFKVEVVSIIGAGHIDYSLRAARVIGVIEGEIQVEHELHPLNLRAGQFCLIPAEQRRAKITSNAAARFIVAEPG